MRDLRTVTAVWVGAVIAGMCLGAGQTTRLSDEEVGRLRGEVKALAERNANLEGEVKQLQSQVARLRTELALRARMGARALPPGGQERGFNGVTVYELPLGASGVSGGRVTEGVVPGAVRDPRWAPAEIVGGVK